MDDCANDGMEMECCSEKVGRKRHNWGGGEICCVTLEGDSSVSSMAFSSFLSPIFGLDWEDAEFANEKWETLGWSMMN